MVPQLARQKAVCLHGFRSNGDALAAQMGALISWQRNYDAVSATLPSVRAVNAVGAVGFSQGGAVAALLDAGAGESAILRED
eukprot:Skav212618  [mRNA]  locus=scaffold2176:313050:315973:- [translate_table: standard]